MVTKEKEEIAPVTTEAQAMEPGTEKPATLNQPATVNAPPKRFPLIPVIIAVLAVGLIVFAGLYFSKRGDLNIKVSPEEKALAAETERQLKETGAISDEQVRKINEQTQRILDNRPAAAPIPAPAENPVPASSTKEWPVKGKWTVRNDLTIIYRETDSAKGKLNVMVDKNNGTITFENRVDRPILSKTYGRVTYPSGKVENVKSSARDDWDTRIEPKEKIVTPLTQLDGMVGTWEMWYEIKVE